MTIFNNNKYTKESIKNNKDKLINYLKNKDEHTPTLIFDGGLILLFIIWVIYNSIVTNDPIIINLI